MKKNILFVIMLCAFIIFPSNTHAICYSKDKVKLLSLAKNIKHTYVFDENTKTFNIIINNIPDSFTIVDTTNNISHPFSGREITLTGFLPGKSYRFNIYSGDVSCGTSALSYIYVNTPVYNLNYSDPLCEGLQDYDICQKWGTYINNREQFEKEISKIKVEEKTKTVEEKQEEYVGIFGNLARLFANSYYIVLPIIIIIGLVGIYRLNKKDRLF